MSACRQSGNPCIKLTVYEFFLTVYEFFLTVYDFFNGICFF
jgi:hypothetical protein